MKNIKDLILNQTPPLEWSSIDNHPIKKLGSYFFGLVDGFDFDKEKVSKCEELELWDLYAEIKEYWELQYKKWSDKKSEIIFNMRNNVFIGDEDLGKDLLTVYEKRFNWR